MADPKFEDFKIERGTIRFDGKDYTAGEEKKLVAALEEADDQKAATSLVMLAVEEGVISAPDDASGSTGYTKEHKGGGVYEVKNAAGEVVDKVKGADEADTVIEELKEKS